jgi:hypothetical protein
VERAIEDRRAYMRRSRNSFEKEDEFWVVFDCDDHPKVAEAIARASRPLKKSIHVTIGV